MIVSDSSFLVEALLNDKNLFEQYDVLVSPDLALYEVINAVWKHQYLFKSIKEDGINYIYTFLDMVESGTILPIRPDSQIMRRASELSGKHRIPIYDSVYLALAIETGLELKSLDGKMEEIFRIETKSG
jgi:predicted nucleic acid-binding protein